MRPGRFAIPCATIAIVLLGVALGVSPADAQDSLAPRVLVIPLDGKGPPSPSRLSAVIVRVAGERGARASLAETGLAETALLVGCDPAETSCLDAMASALNVDHMIFGTVRRRGRGTVVELTVTARQQAPARGTVEIPAGGAGGSDVEDRVSAEVTRLLAAFDVEARAADTRGTEGATGKSEEPRAEPVAPAPRPEPAPPARPARRRVPLWTWAMLASGVVVGAAGGAVWGTGVAQRGDIDDAPTGTAAELESLRDLEDDTELRLRVGGAMAIGGAAIAATATVLIFRARSSDEADAAPRAAVSATPLPGGAAFTVLGHF